MKQRKRNLQMRLCPVCQMAFYTRLWNKKVHRGKCSRLYYKAWAKAPAKRSEVEHGWFEDHGSV